MPIGAFRLNTLAARLTSASTVPTGGIITYAVIGGTNYRVHHFYQNDNFTVPSTLASVNSLLLGAGGGGGGALAAGGGGGGGGAGQIITQTDTNLAAGTYPVVVGTGGTGSAGADGTSNSSAQSTFNGYVALQGYGGKVNSAGNEGGGSGSSGSTSYTATTSIYPFKGGNSVGSATVTARAGGGGAGWTAVGTNATAATNATAGSGGAGTSTASLDGFPLAMAAGGGGGGYNNGTGAGAYLSTVWSANGANFTNIDGFGGGGSFSAGFNSTIVYGSGGGGGNNQASTAVAGGSGMSGLAQIRYATSTTGFVYYVTQAGSSTTTITMPTVSAGDVAFYFTRSRNATTTIPAENAPSGWTNIFNTSVGTTLGTRATGYYKICAGTEGGTTINNMAGTNNVSYIVVYRKQGASITSVTISGLNAQATDSAPTNQSLAMSSAAKPFVGFAFYTGSTAGGTVVTSAASTVKSMRDFYTVNTALLRAFECGSSDISLSNSTISMTDQGTNTMVSFVASIT